MLAAMDASDWIMLITVSSPIWMLFLYAVLLFGANPFAAFRILLLAGVVLLFIVFLHDFDCSRLGLEDAEITACQDNGMVLGGFAGAALLIVGAFALIGHFWAGRGAIRAKKRAA